MKDHELRELINDVTAAARIYAHTQQLREQIAHLITPAFKKAGECHPAACRDEMIWRKALLEAEIAVLETAFASCKPYGEEFRYMIIERHTRLKKDFDSLPTPSSS